MSERLDALGGHFSELSDVAEDVAELWHKGFQFGRRQFQPCELGKVVDLFRSERSGGHAATLAQSWAGIWNGSRLVGRFTRPERMQATQTRSVWTDPPTWHCMRWRFGRNVRRLMPVTLRPMPPRYLALPRRA